MKRVFIVKHQASNPIVKHQPSNGRRGVNMGIKRDLSYLHQSNCHFV